MDDVIIMEIDLGMDIQTIIDDELTELTEKTKERIHDFQQVRLLEIGLKNSKADKKAAAERAQDDLLRATFDLILAAGINGCPADTIWNKVKDTIATQSAYTLRMKTWLKAAGGEYVLERKKINKADRFFLIPWNLEKSEDDA